MVALMEIEQASEAVQPMQAAPVAGVGNERELTMSSLLSRMTDPAPEPDSEAVTLEEPEEVKEDEEDSPATSASDEADEADAESDAPKAKNFRGRWDHLDEQERRVVELTAKRGLNLAEAWRAVYGEATPPAPAQTETPETSQEAVTDLDRKIGEQQQRLDELKRRKAEAKGDLELYDAASDAYLEAREALRDLRQQREHAREQIAAQTLQARRRVEAEAKAALELEFPDATTPGTELYEACREELEYLQASNSPLVHDPQAHYKVARRLARALGIGRPAAPSPAPIAAARRSVRPVPAGGVPVEAPAAALERRLATAHSQGAMLELMREIGTPFEALLSKA